MKICFVTGNKGKYAEARESLKSTADVIMENLDPPEIQADTLEEVARFSLEYLLNRDIIRIEKSGLRTPSGIYDKLFLEDAGLFIDHLNGFPGVYSAYVYKTMGYEGILKLLNGVEDRTARFEAAVALVDASGSISLFKGVCKGNIAVEPSGSMGFGFDPIFIPEGHYRTFAEMSDREKNVISHRGRAIALMRQHIDTEI